MIGGRFGTAKAKVIGDFTQGGTRPGFRTGCFDEMEYFALTFGWFDHKKPLVIG
jgi:hypothetical protein